MTLIPVFVRLGPKLWRVEVGGSPAAHLRKYRGWWCLDLATPRPVVCGFASRSLKAIKATAARELTVEVK